MTSQPKLTPSLQKATAGAKAKLKVQEQHEAAKVAKAKAKLAKQSNDLAAVLKSLEKGLGFPSQLAMCRNIAGGDMAAGILLYRVLGLWWHLEKKVTRLGREWIIMPREAWARSAGLSDAEFKNRALPRLREDCAMFLTARSLRLTPSHPNMLGISLDADLMRENLLPWDMYHTLLNGTVIGAKKAKKYPYKTDVEK